MSYTPNDNDSDGSAHHPFCSRTPSSAPGGRAPYDTEGLILVLLPPTTTPPPHTYAGARVEWSGSYDEKNSRLWPRAHDGICILRHELFNLFYSIHILISKLFYIRFTDETLRAGMFAELVSGFVLFAIVYPTGRVSGRNRCPDWWIPSD